MSISFEPIYMRVHMKHELIHILFLWCKRWIFSSHLFRSSVSHDPSDYHSNMLIWCSRKHFLMISDVEKKIVMLNIFCGNCDTVHYFQRILWWRFKRAAFMWNIYIFCNVINLFTATFDHFNASLIYKRINFIQVNSYRLQTVQR